MDNWTLQHYADGCCFPTMREPGWLWLQEPPTEAYALHVDGETEPVSIVRLFPRRLIGSALACHVIGIGGLWSEARHGDLVRQQLLNETCAAIHRRALLAAVAYATPSRSAVLAHCGFVRVQPYLYVRSLVPGLVFTEEEPAVPTPWWRLEPDGRF